MDAGKLLRIFIELLEDTDKLVTALLDTATQLEQDGRIDELPQVLRERLSAIRRTPAVPAAYRTRQSSRRKPRPAERDKSGAFCEGGVDHIELHRRGQRVRVLIPGLEPTWISPEAAALLEALAEPGEPSGDKLVAYKTVPELAARIAAHTGAPLKPHSVVVAISRLRKSLPQPELIRKRDSHARKGEITAYRFALLAGGKIHKHPPDFAATGAVIDAATDGDR